MPKKQANPLLTRPSSNAHPSLSLSKSPNVTKSFTRLEGKCSVADCLRISRSEEARRSTPRPPPVATLHPSLRNLLDVPEALQPRPRASVFTAVSTRTLRAPGLAIPPSRRLCASRHSPLVEQADDVEAPDIDSARRQVDEQLILPGGQFPPAGSLLHTVLKVVAEQWDWHLENDQFRLPSLPHHLREILLSYIATYASDDTLVKSHNTLGILFPNEGEVDAWDEALHPNSDDLSEVTRLDLSRALDTWLRTTSSLKKELTQSVPRGRQLDVIPGRGRNVPRELPESWDNPDMAPVDGVGQSLTVASMMNLHVLKFSNLLHLSISLSPSASSPASTASWLSLLSVTSHLSTLQSLALAYWPQPTLTPHAAAVSATIKSPVSRTLPRISYGGTDMYTEFEASWREAAGILRKLSRHLYCLRWLDLTGCGVWFGALSWTDTQRVDDVMGSGSCLAQVGPDWNGSWRNVEFLALGVGWTPTSVDECGQSSACSKLSSGDKNLSSRSTKWLDSRPGSTARLAATQDTTSGLGLIKQDWDVAEERRKYLAKKELERFDVTQARAHEVARYLRAVRARAKGKWIEVQV